jgi:tetratricopeptide (TPR) repeat protein
MKKILCFLTNIACIACMVYAESNSNLDSLKKALASAKNDTNKVWLLSDIAYAYHNTKPDSSIWYAQQSLKLSQNLNYPRGEARALINIANIIENYNFPKALETYLKALQICEQMGDQSLKSAALGNIGVLYSDQGDYRKALEYNFKSMAIDEGMNNERWVLIGLMNTGEYYENLKLLDSALLYENKAYKIAVPLDDKDLLGQVLARLGYIHTKKDSTEKALTCFRDGITASEAVNSRTVLGNTYLGFARLFQKMNEVDSAIFYATKAYYISQNETRMREAMQAGTLLSELYKPKNSDSTVKYLELTNICKDSLYNQEKTKELQSLTINEQLRQQELAELKLKQEETNKKNMQLAGIAMFIPVFFLLIMMLSKKRLKSGTVAFLGMFFLLMVFEFISLLADPYISNLTNEIPVYIIAIKISLALLLVPVNRKLETFVEGKLTKKTGADFVKNVRDSKLSTK